MVTVAIRLARTTGATGDILVRGDSAYGHSAVVRACLRPALTTLDDAAVAAVFAFSGEGPEHGGLRCPRCGGR